MNVSMKRSQSPSLHAVLHTGVESIGLNHRSYVKKCSQVAKARADTVMYEQGVNNAGDSFGFEFHKRNPLTASYPSIP